MPKCGALELEGVQLALTLHVLVGLVDPMGEILVFNTEISIVMYPSMNTK